MLDDLGRSYTSTPGIEKPRFQDDGIHRMTRPSRSFLFGEFLYSIRERGLLDDITILLS